MLREKPSSPMVKVRKLNEIFICHDANLFGHQSIQYKIFQGLILVIMTIENSSI